MTAEVFTRNPCPYCVSAKKLLEARGVEYTEIPVSETTRETLIERVVSATISEEHPQGNIPKSVPQIFLDGVYIGGYDNLVAHYKALDAEKSA